MSANAPVNPATSQLEVPNKITLQNEQQSIQVTYYPNGFGPIIKGNTEAGPKMEYAGEEGTLTFSGSEVESVDSPLGSLISVTLRPDADAGALIFTLALPKVTKAQGTQSQAFKAIAVKTKTRGFVVRAGADRSYTPISLQGLAETVLLPL